MNTENLVGLKLGEGVVTHVEEYRAHEGTKVGKIYKIDFAISYGGRSLINNTMMIPEKWNGRFVGIGNGGIAGVLGTGWYSFAEDGYAAAQSDLGTSAVRRGEVEEVYGELWADYGHRAIHGMTVTAKAILKHITGKSPDHSYFYGASAGGISGLSEAQRHPADYNGIVCGVPSNNALAFITYLLFCYRKLGGDRGSPLFGEELTERINRCAVEFFKARGDGEENDDFISYPYCGENTVNEFISYLRERIPELTKEQTDALTAVYVGPKNPRTGEQIYCGMPIGAEINSGYFAGDGITEHFDLPWFKLFFGKGFDGKSFDFDRDYEKMSRQIGRDFSANDPDLTEFESLGGKLLMYSGSADPLGPFADHLNYYRRVCEHMGGVERTSRFFKYFILPGRAHSTNGRGVNRFTSDDTASDMISVMRAWCECDTAPDTLMVAHKCSDDVGGGFKFVRTVSALNNISKEGVDYPVCTSERLLQCKH